MNALRLVKYEANQVKDKSLIFLWLKYCRKAGDVFFLKIVLKFRATDFLDWGSSQVRINPWRKR